jgi:HTH-type transcriptional regulator / antitoxin HigA
MNIKPIKNKKDYTNALNRIEKLMDAKKGTPESDELEILSIIVEQYEEKHFTIKAPDPIEALKFYMEQNNLRNKDLVGILGSKGHVSDVLSKKRPLTIEMIRALSARFSIPVEILIKDYQIKVKHRSSTDCHDRMTTAEC